MASEPSALQIRLLLQPLSLLINVASDVAGNAELEPICLPGGGPRAAHRAVLVECKIWACSILDLIGNVRLNLEVRAALKIFEREAGCGRRFDEFSVGFRQEGAAKSASNKLGLSAQADLEAQHAGFSISENKLGSALLDLLTNPMYKDEILSSKALRLFIRISSSSELATALTRVQLLLDPRSIYIYQEIEARSATLRTMARRFVFLKTKVDEHFLRLKQEAEKRETRHLMESSGWFESLEQTDTVDPVSHAQEFIAGIGKMFTNVLNLATQNVGNEDVKISLSESSLQGNLSGQEDTIAKQLFREGLSSPRRSLMRPISSPRSSKGYGTARRRKSMLMENVSAHGLDMFSFEELEGDSDLLRELQSILGVLIKALDALLEQHGFDATLQRMSLQDGNVVQDVLRHFSVHSSVLSVLEAAITPSEWDDAPSWDLMLVNTSMQKLTASCNIFLAAFSYQNPINQQLLHARVHSLILPQILGQSDNYIEACNQFISIHCNNRPLCTKVPEIFISQIVSAVDIYGTRFMYLRALKSIVATKGVPIKGNQDRVVMALNLLSSTEDKFNLYCDSIGYNRLKQLVLEEKMLHGTKICSANCNLTLESNIDTPLTPRWNNQQNKLHYSEVYIRGQVNLKIA